MNAKAWLAIIILSGLVHQSFADDFKGRSTTRSDDTITQSATFLRAKDWGETPKEESAAVKTGTFDYSVAKHEVEIKLDTSGCLDKSGKPKKDGKANVSLAFSNTMHRDGMGRMVARWGLLDPDRYNDNKIFKIFEKSKQTKDQEEAAKIRKQNKITNAACVVGNTYRAVMDDFQIPCDGKSHSGRVWVSNDPNGQLSSKSSAVSNAYEIVWEAKTNGQLSESTATYKINVSPALAQMKKYLVPNNEEFSNIPLKPKVQIGTAHDPECGENVVQVPAKAASLEPYGIFVTNFADAKEAEKSKNKLDSVVEESGEKAAEKAIEKLRRSTEEKPHRPAVNQP